MSTAKLIKYTYHKENGKTFHSYLKMPSPIYAVLKRELMMSLFEQHDHDYTELRVYWIDEDNDEIDIINQLDYEVFVLKCPTVQHLHLKAALPDIVTSVENASQAATNEAEVQTAAPTSESAAQAVHENVECDSCFANPIIGFRYKCLQCPDFDLCEACERKHDHPEHMMARLPSRLPYKLVMGLSGRSSGRRLRRMGIDCPMMAANIPAPTVAPANVAAPAEAGKDRHHRRKLREMRNSFFSNLYNIMQDLAEGGASCTSTAAGVENVQNAAKEVEKRVKATEATAMALAEEAKKRAELAKKAAEAAKGAASEALFMAGDNLKRTNADISPAQLPVQFENEDHKAYSQRVLAFIMQQRTPFTEMLQSQAVQCIAAAAPTSTSGATNAENNTANEATNTGMDVEGISLEELPGLVGPPLMKTGIEILNNLSEMFAKLLDPTAEVNPNVPLQNYFEARKNSTASSRNSVGSQNSTTQTDKEVEVEKNGGSSFATAATSTTSTPDSSMGSQAPTTSELRRSPSYDNEWQIIDKQAPNTTTPMANAEASDAAAIEATKPDVVQKPEVIQPFFNIDPNEISYENLRKELDMEKKKLREDAEAAAAAVAAATKSADPEGVSTSMPTPAPRDSPTAARTYPTLENIGAETAAINTGAVPKVAEVQNANRYHADPNINKAVIAMMAMGFSNEGAWLTQLLESVNGNIAEAVDLMTAAQRLQK